MKLAKFPKIMTDTERKAALLKHKERINESFKQALNHPDCPQLTLAELRNKPKLRR